MKRRFDERVRRGAAEPGADLRDLLRRRSARARVRLPDGAEVENRAGRCFVRRLCYPLDLQHGNARLDDARAVDWERIAERARDPALGSACLECLFLDTETTGLAGGVGTTVFLIGLGFVDGDSLVVEQVFLRAFADEPAALTHVADRLAERPLLVTFVGKCFDRHRLHARMLLHGIDAPILGPRHLDLYYLARRAWKGELPDVRLATVESARLGLRRAGDLPGSEAPRAFLDWIRDGSGPIDAVFEHNRLDVISLVALLAELGRPA